MFKIYQSQNKFVVLHKTYGGNLKAVNISIDFYISDSVFIKFPYLSYGNYH